MPLPAGTKLGPYEIQSLLGAGGMGEVYRARDTRLERDVAIKVLPSSLATDQDRLRRFEQEARAVAALNHPNILTILDVGTAPVVEQLDAANSSAGSPYIVSELLEGSTLRDRLASGALRERRAVEYAIQIAHGLAAAHERGIVHRDLKPDNIFITEDGRVKILDFGLAKLTQTAPANSDDTMPSGTQAGLVLGTVGYMSPEQVRGKPSDTRSDIFSFGVVLYEMLAGRRAFHGESSADVMSAILNHEPPELTATNREISPTLDRIVRHCMEKTPQQRFQSAGDIAFQLSELSGIRSSSAIPAFVEGPPQHPAQRWLIPVSAALLLTLLLVGTWFLARRGTHPSPPQFVQLTFEQGSVDSARFLSDGQSIVSASRWGSDTAMSLYTARLDSQGMRPLGVTADALASVSSAGELLVIQNLHNIGPGYVRSGTLARLPVGGGAPRPILDSVQYADWAPDGKDFAVVRFIPETHLYRLEYPAGKVLYETSGWVSDPRFSRDGKIIAFVDHPIFGDDFGSVAVIDLGGHLQKLSDSYSSAQGLAWSPKGDEIWFSAVSDGVYRSLFATTLSGHVRALLSAPGDIDIQDTRPDGRVLVADVNARIILMVSTPGSNTERDFSWMDWASTMRFSSDGQQILFGDQHSGKLYGTFLRNMDGSPAVRLGDGDPMDISADGKWALSRLPGGPDQLALLPTGAGEPRQITHSKVEHLDARFFPDGRIFSVGNEAGHRERTYLIDLQGNESPITPEGIRGICATSDSKTLLTANDDYTAFQLFPLDGSAPRPLPQLQKGDRPFDFTSDEHAILVRRVNSQGGGEIWRVDLAGTSRTLLRSITLSEVSSVTGRPYVVCSRDGKNYAYRYNRKISSEYIIEGLR
jgi:serine/threonine protein kinase/Tol biopolymer transport system component